MAPFVYALCMLTALAAAILLLRGYQRSRSALLFWSSLCFFGLATNNALLFLDLAVIQQFSLYWLRLTSALVAMVLLMYGLIWEARR